MANILHRPDWNLPSRLVTPEGVFRQRREFLKQLGLAGAGLVSLPLAGCSKSEPAGAALPSAGGSNAAPRSAGGKLFPARRNSDFNPKWELTNEVEAGHYNNFYEFSLGKDVYKYVDKFRPAPWPIQIEGLIEKPLTLDAQELIEMFPLEERVYRFRCVEAWSMIVPWTGFSLSKLIEKVAPKSEAKFIRFETFNKPQEAPGIVRHAEYPWPYFEGLRMEEAMHPLTMVVAGIYGKPLPKQHGAPIRLIVPWKYGYKSIKSIVKIQFVATQPKTFWEMLAPDEYPFESNVNPNVPHPRWSQATERLLDTGDRVKTILYNGYADQVARLYPKA